MRDPSRHILFLATEYAAGMRPYASAIIHALWQDGDQAVIVTKCDDYKQDFANLPAGSVTWIDYPTTLLGKAMFRLRPTRLIKAIERLIAETDINLIYSLTEELVLASSINRLQRQCPVLYTVHDATHHDVKFNSLIDRAKDFVLMARPQRLMLQRTRHIVTNSHDQLDHIRSHYPDHGVYYAPFPTLVNDAIAQGSGRVHELEGVEDGYILFFGNLHLYKGVHLLYNAYLSHPELQDRALVIAGSKDIYFERHEQQAGNHIIFINRFIDDCEVHDLFARAAVVVYPYISATQSGVTSIASYFGKPMVLSDLPFFKHTCEGFQGIEFFPAGDSQALAEAITRSLQSPADTTELYTRQYSPQALTASLSAIINQLTSPMIE